MKIVLNLFALLLVLNSSCTKKNTDSDKANLCTPASDVVLINGKAWKTKNLDVFVFNNGDSIPYAETAEQWKAASDSQTPAWCYIKNNPALGKVYGKLYNWYVVSDPRGVAMPDFTIPNKADYDSVIEAYGGEMEAMIHLKSTCGWEGDSDFNGNGDNSTGFTGIPGGYRAYNGSFYNYGATTELWTSEIKNSTQANSLTFGSANYINVNFAHKGDGRYIRLVSIKKY